MQKSCANLLICADQVKLDWCDKPTMTARLLGLLLLAGCGAGADEVDRGGADGAPPDAGVADSARDGVAEPDASPADVPFLGDLRALDASPGAEAMDAARDAGAPDISPDAGPEPALELDVEPRRLHAGEELAWELPARARAAVQIRLVAWRVEDARFSVDGAPTVVHADGSGAWRWLRLEDFDGPGWGPDGSSPLWVGSSDAPWTLRIRSEGGGSTLLAARVVDPGAPLPDPAPEVPPRPVTVLEVPPCGVGCDDAEGVAAAIEGAPPGPLEVRLSGAYAFRTTLLVRRDDVHLHGVGDAHITWDPAEDGRWAAAIRFAGGGPDGAPLPLDGPHPSGADRFVVGELGERSPTRVSFEADDFGEVPAVCVDGRDVERFDRHIRQLLRVEEVDGHTIVTDRPVHLEVPAEAGPRLVEVRLLRGARISDLSIDAACPEALAVANHTQAPCANAGVLDDRGVHLLWTEGAVAERVLVRAFGKEAIVVESALETRVEGCSMDHPAAYGDGGQGYGVHVIRASRTLVRDERVHAARHGVVVDFGSSDTQVVGGRFEDMNQALVDIHGEASRDTLVRGVEGRDAPLGIIVGGGGHEVHCNDGPRHHLQHNVLSDIAGASLTVADATRGVEIRGNHLRDALLHVVVAFGAGDVVVERNRFGPSGARAINVVGEGSGGLVVRRNLFEADCDLAGVWLATDGGEAPAFADNALCPE